MSSYDVAGSSATSWAGETPIGVSKEEESPDLILSRFAYSEMGTFGKMRMPDGVRLYTVERPWLGNAPSISCIPCGDFKCVPRRFFRGGYDAVEIMGVPGRSHILFHVANKFTEVEGCVGVNSTLSCSEGVWCGGGSRAAFEKFMEFYNREFRLRIENFVGGVL